MLGGPLDEYVDRADVEAALDPAESAASRDSAGGPAADAVANALADAESGLDADAAAVDAERSALADAEDARRTEVTEYV